MKVLQVNVIYPYGSTGRICEGIKQSCDQYGIECVIATAYGHKKDGVINISSWLDNHIHNRIGRITMLEGCFSKIRTLLFLKKVKKIQPDIIHLHNIHGNYINVWMLLKYIKKQQIHTVFTAHDCWALTGYCKYFTVSGCQKWKANCGSCPVKRCDAVNVFDNSKKMLNKKKTMLGAIEKLTIVTPSLWLASLFRESYLHTKEIRVINNGIDLSVFHKTESDFRQRYNIEDKRIILGVAFDWGYRKGLDVFIELAKKIDHRKVIVLVGLAEEQTCGLPSNVISIGRTNSQKELAEIYSAADVFFNPTREDNYPTVNMESIACGTPVVTFNTGGSPEMVDEKTGRVVYSNSLDEALALINEICDNAIFEQGDFDYKATNFDKKKKYKEYIDLYFDCLEE